MILGHYAVAFAAKKATRKTSLGTLVFAGQFLDLLWPILLLVGLERVRIEPGLTAVTPFDFEFYPISHSLLAVVVWSLLIGGVYMAVRKNRRAAVIVGLLVLSHWVLDIIVHLPDLPLVPGWGPKVGFGLWRSLPGTLVVEFGMWIAGIWVYTRATEATDAKGRWGFWSMVVVLTAMYLASVFGPVPTDQKSFGAATLGLWLFVPWAAWADRHRAHRLSP